MNDEGMLARWSRRKRQDSASRDEEDRIVEQAREALVKESTDAPVEIPEPPLLTDADMPDVGSLTEESDFSGFMSRGVSDELRNLALRKLFGAPSFNVRDGLDEYDDDYTKFEPLGDTITCDMKHQMEMEARKRLEREQAALLEGEEPSESPSEVTAETESEARASLDDKQAQDIENPTEPRETQHAAN